MAKSSSGKSSAQLDREIESALSDEHRVRGIDWKDARGRFEQLLHDDDPSSMEIAEDLLLESGVKLREVAGGLRARNFTIDQRPLHGPRDQWKMVQTSIDKLDRRPGYFWAKWSVANGSVRVYREREFKISDIDSAKEMAVATAWSIAKALKRIPMSASEGTVAKLTDESIARGKKNVGSSGLF